MTAVADLAGQICAKAVEWLRGAREHFAFDDLDSALPDGVVDGYKPLAELATAAMVVMMHNAADDRTQEMAHDIAGFAWRQLNEGGLLFERLLKDGSLTDPLEVYFIFHRLGYRHAELDRLLVQARGLRQARSPELVPHRLLGVYNAERVVGLSTTWDRDELARRTWLGGVPEPWTLTWENAYAATHTVFHVTDWGLSSHGLPPAMDGYLRRWLPAWLEVYGEAGQWDLLGELLFVDECLSRPARPTHIWTMLAKAQHDDGMMPQDSTTALSGKPQAVARRHYHPTVVAAAASSLALAHNGTPPR